MLRLSRSRVISDIEFIINNPGPALGQRKWISKGTECSVDRHSFVGDIYSFHVNILQVRLPAVGSPKWKLLIIGEFWQSGEGESIHSTKWLKLLHGKPGDVVKWISMNRASVAPSMSDSVTS
ncbi:MAG: hypothetical protein ACLPOA_20985 [Methylocella sp.]